MMRKIFGKKVFLVTGAQSLKTSGKIGVIRELLAKNGIEFFHFIVSAEPEIERVELAVKKAREENCDLVIGIGGGSVLDLAKAVAGLLTNEGELLDYLEVIGRGQVLRKPATPFIAIPTTAGTGSEVTNNAVIKDPINQRKVSFRSPYLLARVALIDPELTYSLSPALTAQTGLDALVHLIEAYTSKRAQPLTDLLCRDGIWRIGRSLTRAYKNGNDPEAREDLALASLEGGLALSNSGLGAVHGLAAVLGGSYSIPHGLACAILLPYVLEANIQALRAERGDNPIFSRYKEIAEWLLRWPLLKSLKGEDEIIEAGLNFIRELLKFFQIPSLSQFGVKPDDFLEIAQKAAQSSSMKANPVTFSQEELVRILQKACFYS